MAPPAPRKYALFCAVLALCLGRCAGQGAAPGAPHTPLRGAAITAEGSSIDFGGGASISSTGAGGIAVTAPGGVTVNNATLLTGLHPSTWSGPWAAQFGALAYTRLDNMVMIGLPHVIANATGSGFIVADPPLPLQLRPTTSISCAVRVRVGTYRNAIGVLIVGVDGVIYVGSDASCSMFGGGTGLIGFYSTGCSYAIF